MKENQNCELQQLEEKIDALILLCDTLKTENTSLKIKQIGLLRDRAELIEKNSIARIKVEAMTARLKLMECDR